MQVFSIQPSIFIRSRSGYLFEKETEILHRRKSEFAYYSGDRLARRTQSRLCQLDTFQLDMAVVRMSESQEKQIVEIGLRQMELFGTTGRCEGHLRKFSFAYILFDKVFILPDQQFVSRLADNELPFVKTGRIVQQAGDMPYQDRTFVGIRIPKKLPADIIGIRSEDSFPLDTCNASLSAYEKNVYSSIRFSKVRPSNSSGWNATVHRPDSGIFSQTAPAR